MSELLKLNDPKVARRHGIVDMGLGFSAMMRLYEKGSKRTLRRKILDDLPALLAAKSETEFIDLHSAFCRWGIENISVTKKAGRASYGQIAKTLDVVLKVTVHDCHLPDCQRAAIISPWLNAAMDTKMMHFLRGQGYVGIPETIKQVDHDAYEAIQDIVCMFIEDRHNGDILKVEFDDMYWEALNGK